MISRSTDSAVSPQRHCQIAECSESTGRSSASCRRASAVTICPAITSTSLFAMAIALPARAAASDGASPAAPTVATTTTSTAGCAAISAISAHSARIWSPPIRSRR